MSLDAPAVTPAESDPPTPAQIPSGLQSPPVEAPSPSPPKQDAPPAPNPPNPQPPQPAEKKLTPKELKEQKKAEKAARRQQNKAAGPPPQQQQKSQKGEKSPQKGQAHQKGAKKGQDGIVKTIYVSNSNERAPRPPIAAKEPEQIPEPVKDKSLVGLLRDLELEQSHKKKKDQETETKRKEVYGIDHAHPDVHPAILTLGIQINKMVISGSSARCMAFLLAIKRLIEDYECPADSTLNRHLPGAYLSHQINYLTSARPMATATGNTIRWLKTEISKVSPDLTLEASKNHLVEKIDSFIHEKLTAADEMITNIAVDRYIEDDDVILTFSKSQVVEKTLLEAYKRGKRFRVIVVDNRPLLEGKNLLHALCEAGVECEYTHLYGINYVISEATKCFLGAHAVLANGALYSRSGTAVVAQAAREAEIPVIACAETIKFSDKVNIDGIVSNELGDADGLVNVSHDLAFPQPGYLKGWDDVPNTTVVTFRYDITPANCVTFVISEHGCVTAGGVSGVLRASGMEHSA